MTNADTALDDLLNALADKNYSEVLTRAEELRGLLLDEAELPMVTRASLVGSCDWIIDECDDGGRLSS